MFTLSMRWFMLYHKVTKGRHLKQQLIYASTYTRRCTYSHSDKYIDYILVAYRCIDIDDLVRCTYIPILTELYIIMPKKTAP